MSYVTDSVFAQFYDNYHDAKERIKKYPQFGIAADIHKMSQRQLVITSASFIPKDDYSAEATADKFGTPKKSQMIVLADKDTFVPVFAVGYKADEKSFSVQTGIRELKTRGSASDRLSRHTLVSTSPSYITRNLHKNIHIARSQMIDRYYQALGGMFRDLQLNFGADGYPVNTLRGAATMYAMKVVFGEIALDQVPEEVAQVLRREREKYREAEKSIKTREDRVSEIVEKGAWVVSAYPHGYLVGAVTFVDHPSGWLAKSIMPSYFVKDLKDLPDEIRKEVFVSLAMCKTHRLSVEPDVTTFDEDGYIPTNDIRLPDYGAIAYGENMKPSLWKPHHFIVSR